MVGCTIVAHQPAAVQREGDIEVLDRHVVDQLVVAALQEGRVDRDHRLHAIGRQACGEGDGVLLGDADVEVALGELLLEAPQTRALAHGRRDAHQTRLGARHVAQPVAEDLGVARLDRAGRRTRADTHRGIELAGPVIQHRIGLGQLVSLALARDHVQELRALERLQVLQGGDQRVEVMAVDRANVVEAELLEHRARHDHALGVLLELLGKLENGREVLQDILARLLGGGIEAPAHQPRQVAVQRSHCRRDRHVVVVEDDQQLDVVGHADVVHGLEGHAAGHGRVADHGDGVSVRVLRPRGHRHAERGRNAGRRMGGTEGVVRAFHPARKTGHAAELPQRRHTLAPTGQDLVRIALVAHVPDQPVGRRVEDVVQGDGEFDGAQVGRQVPAGPAHAVQQIGAQLLGQLLELHAVEAAQVGGVVDALEQLGHGVGLRAAAVERPAPQLFRSTMKSANCRRRTARAAAAAGSVSSAPCASCRSRSAHCRAALRPSIET